LNQIGRGSRRLWKSSDGKDKNEDKDDDDDHGDDHVEVMMKTMFHTALLICQRS